MVGGGAAVEGTDEEMAFFPDLERSSDFVSEGQALLTYFALIESPLGMGAVGVTLLFAWELVFWLL